MLAWPVNAVTVRSCTQLYAVTRRRLKASAKRCSRRHNSHGPRCLDAHGWPHLFHFETRRPGQCRCRDAHTHPKRTKRNPELSCHSMSLLSLISRQRDATGVMRSGDMPYTRSLRRSCAAESTAHSSAYSLPAAGRRGGNGAKQWVLARLRQRTACGRWESISRVPGLDWEPARFQSPPIS